MIPKRCCFSTIPMSCLEDKQTTQHWSRKWKKKLIPVKAQRWRDHDLGWFGPWNRTMIQTTLANLNQKSWRIKVLRLRKDLVKKSRPKPWTEMHWQDFKGRISDFWVTSLLLIFQQNMTKTGELSLHSSVLHWSRWRSTSYSVTRILSIAHIISFPLWLHFC